MTTIRVRAQVPESRQVTLTLPADVPVGEADLEVTVRDPGREPAPVFEVVLPPDNRPRAFPPRPTDPAIAAEYDAFERLLPVLMKQYPCQYVALQGGAVVAVGDTRVDAATAAHRLQPGVPAYTRLVTDQPLPVERIGSPREVRRWE